MPRGGYLVTDLQMGNLGLGKVRAQLGVPWKVVELGFKARSD